MKGPRRYGILAASRWPVTLLDQSDLEIPWKERLLSVVAHHPESEVELHAAYIPPGSSNGWTKIETFEGIYEFLAVESSRPRILCGDFNSPQLELEDGRTVLWGQKLKANGEIINTNKPRWPEGERSVIRGLAEYDLPDVYRLLNGLGAEDYSWIVKRKGEVVSRRRFDHIFASPSLNPVSCRYLHELRTKGLSDHSAVEGNFLLGKEKASTSPFQQWAEENVPPVRSSAEPASVNKSQTVKADIYINEEHDLMKPERDDIRDPDPQKTHRAAFLAGWTKAEQGDLYTTMTEKKTHANMGNLFGWIYGRQSQEFKLAAWYRYLENMNSEEIYDWDYYAENHGRVSFSQFRIAVETLNLIADKYNWQLRVHFTKEYVGFKIDRINIFSVNWFSRNSWMVAVRIRGLENPVRQFNHWEFKRFENNDSVALYQPKDSYFPRVEELEPYLVEVYKHEKGRS